MSINQKTLFPFALLVLLTILFCYLAQNDESALSEKTLLLIPIAPVPVADYEIQPRTISCKCKTITYAKISGKIKVSILEKRVQVFP